jgi:hypothetical protein
MTSAVLKDVPAMMSEVTKLQDAPLAGGSGGDRRAADVRSCEGRIRARLSQ